MGTGETEETMEIERTMGIERGDDTERTMGTGGAGANDEAERRSTMRFVNSVVLEGTVRDITMTEFERRGRVNRVLNGKLILPTPDQYLVEDGTTLQVNYDVPIASLGRRSPVIHRLIADGDAVRVHGFLVGRVFIRESGAATQAQRRAVARALRAEGLESRGFVQKLLDVLDLSSPTEEQTREVRLTNVIPMNGWTPEQGSGVNRVIVQGTIVRSAPKFAQDRDGRYVQSHDVEDVVIESPRPGVDENHIVVRIGGRGRADRFRREARSGDVLTVVGFLRVVSERVSVPLSLSRRQDMIGCIQDETGFDRAAAGPLADHIIDILSTRHRTSLLVEGDQFSVFPR